MSRWDEVEYRWERPVPAFTRRKSVRIPSDGKDAYAIGFMVGYLGEVPDEMSEAYGWESGENIPLSVLTGPWIRAYREGHETGAAFFNDHAVDEEGE